MSTTPISTDSNGNQAVGTSGSSLSNSSNTQISSNEFLDLMMTELTHQDPTNPDSSDPTQYLSQLAQLTSVEQETDTAQSTAESATEQAVSQSVGLIGQTITYVDQKSGDDVTGTVNSVQITANGPTLTVDGTAGIDPANVIAIAPTSSGDDGGSDSDSAVAPNAAAPTSDGANATTPSTGDSDGTGATSPTADGSSSDGSDNSNSTSDPFVF